MIGTTLSDIRDHLESLACDAGPYYLVCGRTGVQPVPADGLTFDSRTTARAAARATEQYRAALRRYDPQLAYHDVIVSERAADVWSTEEGRPSHPDGIDDRHLGRESVEPSGPAVDRSLIDFCHTVAGAVFETVAESSHAGVEGAIMDTYLETAETVDDPDELCLRLIESAATELDERLDPGEQAALLRTAAGRLPDAAGESPTTDGPIDVALSSLQSAALLETYAIHRRSARSASSRSWEVTVDGYALGDETGRIVTLPIVVELFRHASMESLTITEAKRVDGGTPATWRLTLTTAELDEHYRSVTLVGED